MDMNEKITKEKLEKYFNLSSKALDMAKKSIAATKKEEAEKIIEMVSCYLADSKFFVKNQDFVNAFAAINYAHGWLDCGARLGIFNVKDRKLFTVK